MIDSRYKSLDIAKLCLHSLAIFVASLAFLSLLGVTAPFSKELGVCEAGAVKDVLHGQILLPHYHDQVIVQAPPLYWWLAAVSVRLIGFNELALRLPSLLAAAATCEALYVWGYTTLGSRFGLTIVALMLTCHIFLDAARQPRMDALLTFFVTASTLGLETTARSVRPGPILTTATGLALGMGVLAKGPPGIILPLLAIVGALGWDNELRKLFKTAPLAEIGTGLTIGVAWYVAASLHGGSAFYQWQIVDGLIKRFFGGASGAPPPPCPNPPWYYLLVTAKGFFPWTLFLPSVALIMLGEKHIKTPKPTTLAASWFLTTVGFFSLSKGKCFVYILPAFPALAILLAYAIFVLTDHSSTFARAPLACFNAAALLISVGTLALLSTVLLAHRMGLNKLLSFVTLHLRLRLSPSDQHYLELFDTELCRPHPISLLLATLSLCGASTALVGTLTSRRAIASLGVIAICLSGSVFWFNRLAPSLAEKESLKVFAHKVDAIVPTQEAIYYLGMPDCDLLFYSQRTYRPLQKLCDVRDKPSAFVVLRASDLTRLPTIQPGAVQILTSSEAVDSHGARILISETPACANKPTDDQPRRPGYHQATTSSWRTNSVPQPSGDTALSVVENRLRTLMEGDVAN